MFLGRLLRRCSLVFQFQANLGEAVQACKNGLVFACASSCRPTGHIGPLLVLGTIYVC